MPDGEILKFGFEAVSVRAGTHYSYHDRMIVLQPRVAHHRVLLIIERVENLYGIQSAHRLNPYERYGFVQWYDTPIARTVSHNS